jgi:hypothetical protein
MSAPNWPPVPEGAEKDQADYKKILFKAQVDEVAAERSHQSAAPPPAPEHLPAYPRIDATYADLVKAAYDAELKRATSEEEANAAQDALVKQTDVTLMREFWESVRDVAKAGLTRADALPQLVITAAGALVTLYTGILALVFAASSHPMPWRGLIPALLLGLAIGFATAYAAYIRPRPTESFTTAPNAWENAEAYTNGFIDWINKAIDDRAWFMRGAVLFLWLGVAFLPSAFLDITTSAQGTTAPANTTVASPSLAAWPTFSSSDQSVAGDLAKILYQAQVSEVATQRAAAAQAAAAPTQAKGPVLDLPLIEELLWPAAAILAMAALLIAWKGSGLRSWLRHPFGNRAHSGAGPGPIGPKDPSV